MLHREWTPVEWFAEAVRCYTESHQGCAWCQGENRVYRTARGDRQEYHCGGCDFFACYEESAGQYHVSPGRARRGAAPSTMLAIEI